MTSTDAFRALFEPASIAVVGASASAVSGGNRFIRHLKSFGYSGKILPIHPSAAEIEGLPTLTSLGALPAPVDYAYVAVSAKLVPEVLRDGRGLVRFAQVMSSGFGETEGGSDLQTQLVDAAREAGIRVIGPNCLGVYSPKGRVTFTERTTVEAGTVGIICQSGGLGIDIIRRGQNKGLRYSGVITVGNCADVKPSELLEYFCDDSSTSVIGLYLEGTTEGRRLFDVLRKRGAAKPIVLLKGGRSTQGLRAAASHTGALAGSERAWEVLAKQTGVIFVDTLDEFLDMLVAFHCLRLRPTPTRRVVLFGNGGGTSVLGTDAFDRHQFEVPVLSGDCVATLEALKLPAGSSVRNPIDVPAGALQQDQGRAAEQIIATIYSDAAVDALVMHINMTVVLSFRHVDMLGNLVEAALRIKGQSSSIVHLILVLRSDGEADIEERKREHRQQAVRRGVPVFDELSNAAKALSGIRELESFRAKIFGRTFAMTMNDVAIG